MSLIPRDVRFAARTMLRAPGFAAIVVVVLALGIGANSAIFSVVNAVLLRPLPYRDPGRLYRLYEVSPKNEEEGVSPADLLVFSKNTHVFEKLAVSHWENLTLTGPEGPENVFGGKVSADCFEMLGSRPAIGRVFRAEEFRTGAPAAVLLSDRLWRRRFGADRQVIGRQLMMNGNPYVIAGVMPSDFFFDQRFAVWTPWQFTADDTSQRYERASAVVRLRPGVTAVQARAEAEAVFRNLAPDDARKGWNVRLVPLAGELTASVRPALLVALGAVGFVLLIACLNVANLLLARASERGREIAVRTALGAGRLRVVRQLLTESLLLSVVGGAAGLLLGAWGARALVAMFPEQNPVPRLDQTHLDTGVLLFTLALSLATGLVFGLIPSLQASRADLNEALQEGGRGTHGRAHSGLLRQLLVVAETALSLVLLAGAGLMLRSFDRLMRVNPGFDPESVLTLRVPLPVVNEAQEKAAYYTRMIERLQRLPGLNSVGFISPIPLGHVDSNGTFAVEGHPPPPGERQLVKLRAASPGYFRAMGIGLREGRVFRETDTAAAPGVAVINQTLARKYFPNKDPIGRRVTMSDGDKGPFLTVVGVVNDVNYINLGGDPAPEMYRDYRQFFFAPFAASIVVRASSGDPLRLAAAVQREVRAASPDQPIEDLKTMREVIYENVSRPRFQTLLLGVFAALALLLAAAGLYGVLSYSVSRRAREIGIRMALGASRGSILRLVMGEALALVAAGVALGLAGSFALTRLIASQLYHTQPTDPLTLAVVSLLLAAVAAAASYLPARRAVKVDPNVALRCE